MLAATLVHFYLFWHGRLGLPGAGLLLRFFKDRLSGLHSFPLDFGDSRVSLLDFRDQASFSLLNYKAGDWGNHRFLLQEMERRIGPGQVFWDVGANVGLVSLHFSQRTFGLAKIHSFEPVSRPRKSLASLFAHSPRVQVNPFGLSSGDRECLIYSRRNDSSYGALSPANQQESGEKIRVRLGDALVAEGWEPPHLMKIDVEGHEPEVLSGLQNTIARFRPIIFFEHIFLSDEQIRKLVPLNYRLSYLLEDGTWTQDSQLRRLGHEALLEPWGL